MVNKQVRNPGQLLQFEAQGKISADVPAFAAYTGQAAETLAKVAGGLSATLMDLAGKAAAREGEAAGLSAGQQSGDAYLQSQATADAAAASANGPGLEVRAPSELRKIVSDAAIKHGVDPGALMKIAMIESSFNPKAKNPDSSAGGLFQFIDDTAKAYGLVDRYDPAQSADAAARLARDNAASLRKVLGRDPTAGELYLAHQQGGGGASKLLKNANARAVDVVGADAVRLNGGTADMTAGQFAHLWIAKAGGGPGVTGGIAGVTPPPHGVAAPLSTQPLALRNDGTIRGEAFDRAAMGAYSWRMQEGLSNDLYAAHEANQNDPAGYQKAAEAVRDKYLQDDTFRDPKMREIFDQQFVNRNQAYLQSVTTNHEKQLREEQVASYTAGLAAQQVDLERQAQLLGANPNGDTIIGQQVSRIGTSIDAAVEAGTITPAQAETAKLNLAETAARGRIQGVYEALPTPTAKREFARSLMDNWRAGDGPLSKIPFATVKGISETLYNNATDTIEKNRAENRQEAVRLSGLISDDVASLETTGQGLNPDKSGLSVATVSDLLGEDKVVAWQQARERAGSLYRATAGMETQSAADLAHRLQLFAPQAGEAGYADRMAVFEAVQKKANSLLKQRSDDPASAVERAFPRVAELATMADPQKPETMQTLVTARLQAQDALDIPELAREPLTQTEALSLARTVTLQRDPQLQGQAMMDLVSQVDQSYGPHRDAVLRQVLSVSGMDKDMATMGAGLLRKISSGGTLSNGDRSQGQVMSETASADRSGKPMASDVAPLPNYKQQQMLLENPQLSDQYDAKFGAGAAQRLLGGRKPASNSFIVPQGRVTLNSDGSEDFTPNKK